jgi:benzodiazapine receptor
MILCQGKRLKFSSRQIFDMNKWIVLIIAILVCQAAGIIGSIFTYPSIGTWYAELEKPFFTPPNWVFGPVWITLYTLMGISLFWIWQKGPNKENVRGALLAFFGQLVLNSVWSIVFFGLQSPFYALILIVMLWFLILLTIFKFYKIDKKAGLILIPYILWVTIATALNYYIFVLN